MTDDWIETTLGECLALCRNGVVYRNVMDPVGDPISRIQSISTGEINFSLVGYAEGDREFGESDYLQSGDVLFSHINSLPQVGNTAIYKEGMPHLVHGMNLLRLRATPSMLPEFLHYLLQEQAFRAEVRARAQKAVNQVSINIKALKSIPVSFPPLPTQRRIVDLMTHLDAHIANLQAERVSASSLLDALTTLLLFSGESRRWPLMRMGDAFDVRDGTHESPKYVDAGFPLLTSKNLTSGQLSHEGAKMISREDFDAINVRSGVAKGDLLMAMIGTIGNVCVVESEPDFAVKNVAIFKSRTDASRRLLYYQLKSREMNERMTKEATGSTQRFVSLSYLRNLELRIPPPPIARQFVSILDSGRSVVQSLEEEAAVAASMRDRMLSAILTQQVDIRWEHPLGGDEVA